MKKLFTNPEMEIKGFELENIVTTSAIKGNEDTNITDATQASVGVDLSQYPAEQWVDGTLF